MHVIKNTIYSLWHRNYHKRIENEFNNRMKKSYQISNKISDLEENEPINLINYLINSFKLNLARTQLKLYFSIQKTLLELHCLEIDFMDNIVKA